MAHSFVTAFPREIDAFLAYARAFPDSAVLLLDTYDTVAAARQAVEVARGLAADGHRLAGVRLDSGDLAALSREVRAILDGGGFPDVRIIVSGGLDEHDVAALLAAGAPIDGFGVGTRLDVSADAPSLEMVYKLVSFGGRDTLKVEPGKGDLGRREAGRPPARRAMAGWRATRWGSRRRTCPRTRRRCSSR